MLSRSFLALAVFAATAWPAYAAEPADFITGTYSSQQGCDAMAKHQEQSGDFLYLSAKGISGNEFTCEFVNVFPRAQNPGWVAIAFCEEPGISHPEILSLMPRDGSSLEVSAPDSPYADEGFDNPEGDMSDSAAAGDAGGAEGNGSSPQSEAQAPAGDAGTDEGADSVGYVGLAGLYKRCAESAN